MEIYEHMFGVLAVIAIVFGSIGGLIAYACCVVSGECSRAEERQRRKKLISDL